MTLLQFACPYCQAPFQIDDSLAGQQAACPTCGGLLTVPGGGPPLPPQAGIGLPGLPGDMPPPPPPGAYDLGMPPAVPELSGVAPPAPPGRFGGALPSGKEPPPPLPAAAPRDLFPPGFAAPPPAPQNATAPPSESPAREQVRPTEADPAQPTAVSQFGAAAAPASKSEAPARDRSGTGAPRPKSDKRQPRAKTEPPAARKSAADAAAATPPAAPADVPPPATGLADAAPPPPPDLSLPPDANLPPDVPPPIHDLPPPVHDTIPPPATTGELSLPPTPPGAPIDVPAAATTAGRPTGGAAVSSAPLPRFGAKPAPVKPPAPATDAKGAPILDTKQRVKLIGSGPLAREVVELTPEEKQRRRRRRSLAMMLVGLAVLGGAMAVLMQF